MRRVLLITVGVGAVVLVARGLGKRANTSTSPPGGETATLGGSAARLDSEPGASLGQRLGDFLAQVREAAAEREAELRAGLGLDGRHDAVDAPAADNPATGSGDVRDNR